MRDSLPYKHLTVTVVCDVLGKENNGSTVAANNLINYLREQGHTVKVLCADAEKKDKKGYFVVPNRNFYCFNKYVAKNGVTLAKPDEDIIRFALFGSDIIHVMFPFALGIASAKIAKQMNIPVTAGFHMLAENFTTHLRLENVEIASRLTYAHFYKLYKNCDAIHFPTLYLKDLYERMYGKTNGYVISNGVNDMFKPKVLTNTDEKIQIVTVGRLSKEKSQEALIDAVKLSAYADKIQLVFAGSGPLKEKLRKRAAVLPVPGIFGFYTRNELVDVLNKSYLYIHTAQIEAEGISCLEAIACGVVPIISDSEKCATKAYALTERNLFRFGDARDLACKIDWWIEHAADHKRYGKYYADYAKENFNQAKCMAKMEKMLLQTVNIRTTAHLVGLHKQIYHEAITCNENNSKSNII